MMDLQNLQQDWADQYRGKNINPADLVVKLYQESRQKKITGGLRKLTLYNIIFMVFHIVVIGYSWLLMVQNWESKGLVVGLIVLLALTYTAMIMVALQFDAISKINYSKPIVELQKLIYKMKKRRITFNRFMFYFSNLYFWAFLVLFFRWDPYLVILEVLKNAPIVVYIHVTASLLWFPFARWILQKYDDPNKTKFWAWMEKDAFLTDQPINFTLNNILADMNELEAFEKEEVSDQSN